MKTRALLLATPCSTTVTAMGEEDIYAYCAAVPEWAYKNGALERTFTFTDYYQTLAFVNALAIYVHTADHHPDLHVSYNRCVVRFNTHSVQGISLNDFICAAHTDRVYNT